MRRTVTAIIAFLVWLAAIRSGLVVTKINFCLGVYIIIDLTILISIVYMLADHLMADLDEEARERKRKRRKYKVPQSDDSKFESRFISQGEHKKQDINNQTPD